jgi:hypothetical protein
MIELIPGEGVDVEFLALVQRIVNGALDALDVREVFLVHVDNWFDHKWLGWRSRSEGELGVPSFDPNRVRSENRFIRDENGMEWTAAALREELHRFRPGRSSLKLPLDRFSKSAAFIWYSGNSVTNRAGSLMLYLSGAERYSWYASFVKDEQWKVHDERQITRRQLLTFEAGGRELVRS